LSVEKTNNHTITIKHKEGVIELVLSLEAVCTFLSQMIQKLLLEDKRKRGGGGGGERGTLVQDI
jgi:hypothetical protein